MTWDWLQLVHFTMGSSKAIQEAYTRAKDNDANDGLLFCHTLAKYEGGLTPLWLQWKDSTCSPWFIDAKVMLC